MQNSNNIIILCGLIVALVIQIATLVELYKQRNLEKQIQCKYCHYHDGKGTTIAAKSNGLMTVQARIQKGKTNGIPVNKIVFSEAKGLVFIPLDKNAKFKKRLSFDIAYCPMCGRKLSRGNKKAGINKLWNARKSLDNF